MAITVQATVAAPLEKVWACWTEPKHITGWNFASADWHCPAASNDLRTGGSFSATMAAKDGSMSFEFGGNYTQVEQHALIAYTMGDGRKVSVQFEQTGDQVLITETFDPETIHPQEMQQAGWQAILNNFKLYTEQQ